MNKEEVKTKINQWLLLSKNEEDEEEALGHEKKIHDLIIEFTLSKGIHPYLDKYKLSIVIQDEDNLIEQGLQELEGWQSEFKSVFLEVAVNAPTLLQHHPIVGSI